MTIDELKKKYEVLKEHFTYEGERSYKSSEEYRKEKNYPSANAWLQRSNDYYSKAASCEQFLSDLNTVK